MRYEKGHKEQTRRRIVEAASERFRADGIDAVGVVSLMSDVGLTQGGFYNHFGSKEDLVRDAIVTGFDDVRQQMLERIESSRAEPHRALINAYLSPDHRDNAGAGCVAASLAAEVARREHDTRAVFSQGFTDMVELMASSLPSTVRGRRRRTMATTVMASMAGSLALARAVAEPGMADELLNLGRQAALALIEKG
jgi:TetR/AcrR family transcriptional regulator, transcriptional repressor for nem operon